MARLPTTAILLDHRAKSITGGVGDRYILWIPVTTKAWGPLQVPRVEINELNNYNSHEI